MFFTRIQRVIDGSGLNLFYNQNVNKSEIHCVGSSVSGIPNIPNGTTELMFPLQTIITHQGRI